MTLAVSYTDFRDNLSDHLEYLKRGNKVVVRDAKKGKDVVTLVAVEKEEFDWDSHMKWIKTFKPIFTDRDVEDIKRLRRADRKRLQELRKIW